MKKNIIVTGAAGGIGFELVKELIGSEYNVSACIRSPSEDLIKLQKENKSLACYMFDLADRNSIKKLVQEIFLNKEEYFFGLVNCAGVAHGGLFSMTSIEDIEKIFQINYFNQLYLTQLISKKFIRNKRGSIVNVASTAGIFGDEGTVAYGGSKSALIHSTKVLASELGKFNIRVNSVSPAIVQTKMSLLMDEKSTDKLNSRKSLPGHLEPQDISNFIEFLLSDRSSNVSGQNFRIDQGMFA